MNTGSRAERYSQVAWREIQTDTPRQPQLRQALDNASGDPEAATQFYVSTRVAENTDIETERESAERRLHKLWQFHDGLALLGSIKLLLFGILLLLVIVGMCYLLFSK